MSSHSRTLAFAMIVAILLVVGGALTYAAQSNLSAPPPPFPPPLPTDADTSCSTSLTVAEFNSWFVSGAVTLDGAVKPADSVLFPNIPNCSFYKWSEQMFLWLTSPAPASYGGGGLVMNTPVFYDVSPPDSSGHRHFQPHISGTLRAFNLRDSQLGMLGLPVVLEKGTLRILEVIPPVLSPAGSPLVSDVDGNEVEVGDVLFTDDHKPILLDTFGNKIESPRALLRPSAEKTPRPFEKKLEKLDLLDQAAGLPGFDRSELVEKIELKDQVILITPIGTFPETEQGQADGGVLMSQNGSLVYYALSVNNVMALYRTMLGATVPLGTMFPTTQSQLNAILAFAAANGMTPVIDSEALAIELKSSWVEAESLPNPNDYIQMPAIVPDYDTSDPTDWKPIGHKTVQLAMVGLHIVGSTAGHPEMLWATFEHLANDPAAAYTYAKIPSGTTTIPQNTIGNWVFCANGSAGPFNTKHMQMGSGATAGHIIRIGSFTISPSDVRREMPFGLPGSSAVGNAEVLSINHTVRSLLDPADIRRKYFHEGTTWTIGGAAPNAFNQVGTNKLANTTMETFVQGGNCFGCHGTNTTLVSHIFNSTDPLF
jgi:hypothetical protein